VYQWLAEWRVSPNDRVLHAFPTYFTIHLTSGQTQLPGLDKVLPVQTLPVLQVTEGPLALMRDSCAAFVELSKHHLHLLAFGG